MFISSAFAQEAATATADAAQQGAPSIFVTMLPLIIIFALFYILVIRPQSKRIKEHRDLLEAVKPGDQVVTGGGLIAKVIKVGETEMTLEIASGVQVRAQKHSVSAMPVVPVQPVK